MVGTSNFNSCKTFLEMFNENNITNGTILENIPDDMLYNKVLVFNIEHVENKIISNNVRNHNTLCAVYELKHEDNANIEWNDILLTTEEDKCDITVMKNKFLKLASGMVKNIHVATFNSEMAKYNVNFYMPDVITSFEKLKNNNLSANTTDTIPTNNINNINDIDTIDTISVNTIDLKLNDIINIVNNRNKDFLGYIIYGINGERTKIVNPKYTQLKLLKGNRPIALEQWNTKNLFYLYWRLLKQKTIYEFIREFDTTSKDNNLVSYHDIFIWFANLIHSYSYSLFNSYHYSFVKNKISKQNIPYTMKPLCGELHKMYLEHKIPISPSTVEQFIFNLPAGKLFWRLFSNTEQNY
jgi:hypothetical protein